MNATTLPQTALPPVPKSSFAATDALSLRSWTRARQRWLRSWSRPRSQRAGPASLHQRHGLRPAMPASVAGRPPMPMDLDVSRPGGRSVPPAPDLEFDPRPRAWTSSSIWGPTQPGQVDEPTPDHLANAIDALGDDDGDPLVRQLELAEEFRQIGDTEGAREVLQELVAGHGVHQDACPGHARRAALIAFQHLRRSAPVERLFL